MSDNIETFEKEIILMMIDENLTMSEALMLIMKNNCVDITSTIGMCDFLEDKFDKNMDKVEYFMDIIVGREPDQILVKD